MKLAAPSTALALAVLAGACLHTTTLEDWSCPDGGTSLTYADFGAPFFAHWCNSCHSAPPGQRQGAPEDVVFASRQDVVSWRERIFARAAADNDSMPPGPDDPPQAVRDQLADWLACGAP